MRERRKALIRTTGELARIVAEAVPARFHKKGYHPATQVFQALRIWVNEEAEDLVAALALAPGLERDPGAPPRQTDDPAFLLVRLPAEAIRSAARLTASIGLT